MASSKEGEIGECLDRLQRVGILFLLVFPPLLFGAVEPWSSLATVLVSLFLGILWSARRLTGERPKEDAGPLSREKQRGHLAPLLAAAGLILAWGSLALLPLPAAVLKIVSGRSALPFTGIIDAANGGGFFSPLSLAPDETGEALMRLLAFGIMFLVSFDALADWKTIRTAAAVFITVTFAVSVEGVIQAMAGGGKLLFIREVSGSSPFGPFVNRNHFAAWAGMGALLGFGYFLSLGYRVPDVLEGRGPGCISYRVDRNLTAKRWLIGFMTAVTGGAVFVSLSRGGMLGLLAGITAIGLLLGTRKRLGRGWRALAFLGLVLAVVIWIGAGPVVARMETAFNMAGDYSEKVRAALFRDTARMAGDHLWMGTGPGTFSAVYPLYQTAPPEHAYAHAHNDWLQLLAEWGATGLALFLTALVAFWCRFLGNWYRRRDREVLCLAAGAAGGVTALMAHSLFDFSLRVPAVALAAAFTAGIGLRMTVCRTGRSSGPVG